MGARAQESGQADGSVGVCHGWRRAVLAGGRDLRCVGVKRGKVRDGGGGGPY